MRSLLQSTCPLAADMSFQTRRLTVRSAIFSALGGMCLLSSATTGAWQSSTKVATPAEKFAIAPGGVDMRTGRYIYEETDLVIGGSDNGLVLKRMTIPNGYGAVKSFANFASNWDIGLREFRVNAQEAKMVGGNDYRAFVNVAGKIESFQALENMGFVQMGKGNYAQLTWTGTHSSANAIYTFRTDDGTVVVFRPFGVASSSGTNRSTVISTLTEPDGTVYSFDYDTSGGNRLRSVISNRGFALLLEGTLGQTTKACVLNLAVTSIPADNLCPAGVPTATYSYVSGPKLSSVTDAGGAISSFTYSGAQMGFIKPGQTTPWLVNHIGTHMDELELPQEVIGLQQFAGGESYTYSFDMSPNDEPPVTIAGGSFSNARGEVTEVRYSFPALPTSGPANHCPGGFPCEFVLLDNIVYQQSSGPTEIVDPNGKTIINNYCNPNSAQCFMDLLQWSQDPEGNRTYYTMDAFRNVTQLRRVAKPGSGLADITTSATYGCPANICSKITSRTDGKGKVTYWNYDNTHGGILSEMKPPATDGGPRPLKLTTWTQKYAYIKNSSGVLVPAASPVWVVATETECQTLAGSSSPVCDGSAPSRVSTYQYGADGTANNLWVKGIVVAAGGETRRTCFGYDVLGRKISTTTPNASLGTCP